MPLAEGIRYYPRFPEAVPERGAGCPRVTQPFATLCTPGGALTVRLACVRRAASVHPEPGSNSPSEWGLKAPDVLKEKTKKEKPDLVVAGALAPGHVSSL